MSATKKDIKREANDTYRERIIFTDPETGEPPDFTGGTAVLTVDTRDDPDDDSTEVFSMTGSILAPAATSGTIDFEPSALQAAYTGLMYYGCRLTDSNGKLRTLYKGRYHVVQDIGKP